MAAQDLCSLSDVRQALELPTADTSRDALIGVLITVASDAIMNETEREFAPVTASATRRVKFTSLSIDLAPYDLRTVATLTVHPESSSPIVLVATSEYQLLPIPSPTGTYQRILISALRPDVLASTTPFNFGYALVDINGAWGFASVPTNVNRACVETVISWLRKDVGAFDLGDLAEPGRGLLPRDAFPIPTKAWMLLKPFRRLQQLIA